jgi:peroxiredoxin
MSLTYSQTIPFGSSAPDFALPGIDGKTHTLAEFPDKKALVVVFMCNHCPYVQAVWPKLIELQKEFSDTGVQFVGINSNDAEDYPEDGFEKMKEYAAERRMNFPYLRDETQEVAKKYGAVCTPDIFVYQQSASSNNQFALAYHGRIENDEMATALKALIKGKKPSQDQKPSMGCSIKWK